MKYFKLLKSFGHASDHELGKLAAEFNLSGYANHDGTISRQIIIGDLRNIRDLSLKTVDGEIAVLSAVVSIIYQLVK